MKFADIAVKQKVYDRWWPLPAGVVTKVLKTKVEIYFCFGTGRPFTRTYDRVHVQFLEKMK